MKIGGRAGRNKKLPIMLVLAIALIAAIATAAPSVGRFVPTHKITEPVYCGTCHPDQVVELNETTHLTHFAGAAMEAAEEEGYEMSTEEAISAGCTMCHNYWDNFKWWGVENMTITQVDTGDENHGLGSRAGYRIAFGNVTAWQWGLANKTKTIGTTTYTRMDAVWGNMSAYSPGPMSYGSCGEAEKALCHVAELAAGKAADNLKGEVQVPFRSGGVFFTHEMAYTTAQYSAKPVKLCGACHVFKLPAMDDDGYPLDANKASIYMERISHGAPVFNETIYYNNPDWAHQNVPCIRCHVHAGISEE